MKIKGGIRAFQRSGRYVRASPPGGSFLAALGTTALPALTRNIEEIFAAQEIPVKKGLAQDWKGARSALRSEALLNGAMSG